MLEATESVNSRKKQGKYTPEFKASVALAAIMSKKSLLELSKQFDIHPSTISEWKNQLIKHAELAFHSEIKTKSQRTHLFF